MLLSRRTIAFRGFLVCDPYYLAMHFDRVYVRRLVVMFAYFTCALAGSLTFIAIRHHVTISTHLF